ncbi:MAG: MBL fold metallo-hydrolase, partial [Candidatus Hodarchaeota archaeon]
MLVCVVLGVIIFSGSNVNDEDRSLIIIEEKFLYYNGVNITWYGQAAFKLKTSELVVYIDPYTMGNEAEKADIVIGTHDHIDHLSPADVMRVADPTRSILYTPRPTNVDGFGTTVTELEELPLKEIYYPDPWEIIEKYGISL